MTDYEVKIKLAKSPVIDKLVEKTGSKRPSVINVVKWTIEDGHVIGTISKAGKFYVAAHRI